MKGIVFCRLVGVQGLLEDIPIRRKDSMSLWMASPGESRSLLRRGGTKVYNVKDELSSEWHLPTFTIPYEAEMIAWNLSFAVLKDVKKWVPMERVRAVCMHGWSLIHVRACVFYFISMQISSPICIKHISLYVYTSYADEVMAILRLDNQQVAQTSWKPNSQQCWDHRCSIDLDRVST